MHTTYWNNRRGGHCRGHVRETFLAALDAYRQWTAGEPEPMVEFEIGYEARPILISKAAGLVWNCSDILPASAITTIEMCDLDGLVGRWTYAAAARAMLAQIVAARTG